MIMEYFTQKFSTQQKLKYRTQTNLNENNTRFVLSASTEMG